MPFYKIEYKGLVVIESEDINEAKEALHEYNYVYEEEKIINAEEMDPVDVLDLTGVTLFCDEGE